MRFGQTGFFLVIVLAGCTPVADPRTREFTADGLDLYKRGDYRGARESFEAAARLQPDDLALRYNIGQCQERLGQSVEAEKTYSAVLHKEPGHVEARYSLAQLMVRQGREKDADEMAQEWLQRQPDRAPPYALDGWLWHQRGDLPRAQSRLQQALRYDPHDVRALNELGQVFEKIHRFDRAMYLYEQSLAVQPRQPEIIDRVNHLKSIGAGTPRPDTD